MPVQTISLFDTVIDSADAPVANATVTLTFGYNSATTADGLLQPSIKTVQTDGTGKFTFAKVIPNDLISPANTVYMIETPFRVYEVAPQSGNGASQQSTAANVIINNPLALAPYTLIGPVSVTGTLAVTGALTVVSNTGIQVDALGNISGRSLSLSSTGPYGAFLPGGASPGTVPTPAGTEVGKLVDFGGAVWNLRAFNAKCDGVADDTLAWTTPSTGALAMAGAVGGAIEWTGTTVVTANLNVALPVGIRGKGQGSILKVSGTGFHCLTIPATGSGSWLETFVLDGGASAPHSGAGLNAGSTTDLTLRGIEIKNCGGKGINTGGSPQRWAIDQSRIHDNFDEGLLCGVGVAGVPTLAISQSYFYGNAFNGLDFNGGLFSLDAIFSYGNGNKAGVAYVSQIDRGGLVAFAANGTSILNFTVNASFFFGNTYHGVLLQVGATGVLQRGTFTASQSFGNGSAGATNVADGFICDGSAGGTLDHVSWIGGLLRSNSRCGAYIQTTSQAVLLGVLIDANGGYTVGGQAGTGVYIAASPQPNMSACTITNHTTQAATGWAIGDAATTDAVVANLTVLGNTTSHSDGGTRTLISGMKRSAHSNYQVLGELSVAANGGNTGQFTVFGVGASQQDTNWEAARLYYGGPNWLLQNIAGGTGIARPLQIAGFSSVTISPNVLLSTLGAWASGDKYLIVDSSGNVHKSGLGPAS